MYVGRPNETAGSKLSTRSLVQPLASCAAEIDRTIAGTEWYIFGSALREPYSAADIDLLILCPAHNVADQIRQLIEGRCFARPVDLSLLTFEEETEVDFIRRQGCWRIFPSDVNSRCS